MAYLSNVDELTRLAVAAGKGDQNALAALIRATQSDIWRLCAYLVDPHTADDLTQDTYLRALRQLKRFRGDGPVRSWLLTIARRTCAAEIAIRQRRRDTALDLGAHQHPGAGDHTLQVELAILLDSLEPDRRAAFVLTQIIGCSYQETAQICGCPVGTVRSRVARARDALLQLARPSTIERQSRGSTSPNGR